MPQKEPRRDQRGRDNPCLGERRPGERREREEGHGGTAERRIRPGRGGGRRTEARER